MAQALLGGELCKNSRCVKWKVQNKFCSTSFPRKGGTVSRFKVHSIEGKSTPFLPIGRGNLSRLRFWFPVWNELWVTWIIIVAVTDWCKLSTSDIHTSLKENSISLLKINKQKFSKLQFSQFHSIAFVLGTCIHLYDMRLKEIASSSPVTHPRLILSASKI